MTNTYPAIELDALSAFVTIMETAIHEDDYLDPANCPYDEEIRAKLAKLVNWTHPVARMTVEEDRNPVGRPKKAPALPIEDVETEINDIRTDLKQLKIDGKSLETADQIQIIKTRAVLAEKLIGIKERVTNIKKQQEFISTVMIIMEDLMDQKQREEMIKKLEKFKDE